MMEFVIVGKTMTSNGKTNLWKSFVVLCETVKKQPFGQQTGICAAISLQ